MCNLFAISIRYRTEAIFIPIASHEQDTYGIGFFNQTSKFILIGNKEIINIRQDHGHGIH